MIFLRATSPLREQLALFVSGLKEIGNYNAPKPDGSHLDDRLDSFEKAYNEQGKGGGSSNDIHTSQAMPQLNPDINQEVVSLSKEVLAQATDAAGQIYNTDSHFCWYN